MIIPAIDIIDGKVVRLTQGKYHQKTIYKDNPVEVAKDFEKAGAKRIHVVDLDGAKVGKSVNQHAIKKIRESISIPMEVGGGIRNQAGFKELLSMLAQNDKVMIGSMPIKNREEFVPLAKQYAENILLTVDVYGREIRISGWEEKTKLSLHDFIQEMMQLGLNEFLVTQIQKDGMLSGPDWDLYQELAEKHPKAKWIISGGVSSVEDLQKAKSLPYAHGIILGRAFYEGHVTLQDLATLNS
ncbi:MAG: 1-(5-phosphoribosyl)-5-[(5-phosphoribosylamino)methylideneamino]imidazole-4-carboxamide isomerase [Candidatus Hydrogenedentota bacterium]|nr:MAG: 1-(5-phosphoribosyl)-5-[(5-phosphoribosylamino)methylideneamino]imidazole-4-carboxamide isomerase [Candidatus Hydrogenedentota bacterium]